MVTSQAQQRRYQALPAWIPQLHPARLRRADFPGQIANGCCCAKFQSGFSNLPLSCSVLICYVFIMKTTNWFDRASTLLACRSCRARDRRTAVLRRAMPRPDSRLQLKTFPTQTVRSR
jgi:hypothetical protein